MSAVSNTGPLISAFQSNSFDVLVALVEQVHTSPTCLSELVQHGWNEALARAGALIVSHTLTETELQRARQYARQIAAHPLSRNTESAHHLGEAEAMVLAERPEFSGELLLIDERAARAIAKGLGLDLSGFAGVLLSAIEESLLTPEQVKQRLELCRQQGTHYSESFIQSMYQTAKARGEKA